MRRVGLILGVIAALVAGVALALFRWYEQTPPALVSAGPGTVRLNGRCCAGVPGEYYKAVLAGGSTVWLQFGSTRNASGGPEAYFRVEPHPGSGQWVTLHERDQQTVEGVTVRVLHIWLMPNPSHEAIDVRVTMG